jgi:N-acetylglutamate synthase-like GNAT family acetyltransferase
MEITIAAVTVDETAILTAIADATFTEFYHLRPDETLTQRREKFFHRAEKQEGSVHGVFAARDTEGTLIGSLSVVDTDLDQESYSPWVASLWVHPDHRGKGYGKQLLAYGEDYIRHHNISKVFLFTEGLGPWYRQLGWKHLKWGTCNGYPIEIMSKTLIEL